MPQTSISHWRGALGLAWRLLLLAVLSLPATLAAFAQDEFGQQTDPSPALGHAEVIAHGVVTLPAGQAIWSAAEGFTPRPGRSQASSGPGGFVLGSGDVVAVANASGKLLARVAEGEAVWLPAGEERAVVSLERSAAHYDFIFLASAARRIEDDLLPGEILFSLPRGGSFDVDLLRDVLIRNEESDIPGSEIPGLLLVTDGMVTVETVDGGIVDLAAGDVTEVVGDAIITGTSRAPAAFVVALLGPGLPERVKLRENQQPTVAPIKTPTLTPAPMRTPIPTATPTPTHTPVPTPTVAPVTPAEVAISSFICPVAYEGSDYAGECVSPADGVEFILSQDDAVVRSAPADSDGFVTFAGLEPGDYVLSGGIPGDFASSRVRCLSASGLDIARRHATNQVAVTLISGDEIACDWYIVPEDARGEDLSSSLTVDIRACPEGMIPATLFGEDCGAAPAGTTFTLRLDGQPVGVTFAAANAWSWNDLGPSTYGLDVNAIPTGFVDFQLDDEPCCGSSADFSIQMPKDFIDVRRTLYLFLPQQSASTLWISVLACPPGMVAETLEPDACEPTPPGVDLILLLDGVAVPSDSAKPSDWEWDGLGPYVYGLDVSAPSDLFSGSMLDDQACCGVVSDFTIAIPEGIANEKRTLYLFQSEPEPEQITDGSISVFIHACPPGMTTKTLVEDACGDPPPGVSFSLVADDTPMGVATVADDLWTWEGLPHRAFDLFVNAIPDVFDAFSLGVRQCCNARGALDVATSAETPDTGYILYLYRPADAETLETDQELEAEAEALVSETPESPLLIVDPDGDGLPTSDEEGFFHTDPNNPDTDGDGVNDSQEIAAGTNPLDER